MKKAIHAIVMILAIASTVAAQDEYLQPPRHVGPGLPLHDITNRTFQGISALAVSPKGRLWATWFASQTGWEDKNNYVVLSTSGNKGESWREVLVVDPDKGGPVRAYDSQVWITPEGKLWLCWTQTISMKGPRYGVWMIEIEDPESKKPSYGNPRRLTDRVMNQKPLALSSGEWVLPAAVWWTDKGTRFVVSTDKGKTWRVRGACNVPVGHRAFYEHIFVERKDTTIWLLARTAYGIGESVSKDRGATWPDLKDSKIPHPSARFLCMRLKSGNLLLVKHGPMDKRTKRFHLTAYLSTDDGETSDGGLLLDEREGVSYPNGQQTPDGVIWITHDFDRTGKRHILMNVFREEDVAAGEVVSDAVRLRRIISDPDAPIQ